MDKRVLILDIEASPMEVYCFELGKQYLTLDQIKKDWHIMAWSAKWLGAPASKVIYAETRTEDDKAILVKLWKLLDEADVLVTQNGKDFDAPKIEARMMIHGMQPPSPYEHFDTYKSSSDKAFTSHKLEYLTGVLNDKYKKLKHEKYPGLSLWKECLKGNAEAWRDMKTYNIHDVLSTEELYLRVRPWAKKGATAHVIQDPSRKCGKCGSLQLQKRGVERTKTAIYQRFHCQSCGGWQRGGKEKPIKLQKAA